MAKIYANLILEGLKTIDDVPKALRAKVESILNPYGGMTKAELIEEVESRGIEIKSSMTKSEITEVLRNETY